MTLSLTVSAFIIHRLTPLQYPAVKSWKGELLAKSETPIDLLVSNSFRAGTRLAFDLDASARVRQQLESSGKYPAA